MFCVLRRYIDLPMTLVARPVAFGNPFLVRPSSSNSTWVRKLTISARVSVASLGDLEAAKQKLSTLTEDPGNDIKLQLYGLFKQATVGPCNIKRPGMMDFVGRAKWDAWNSLGDVNHSDAMVKYCRLVDEVMKKIDNDMSSSEHSEGPVAYQEIVVSDEGGARTILLNRPSKYNAITYKMYSEIQHALKAAGENSNVVVTVITGAGDFFCSGNDLSNFLNIPPEGPKKMAAEAREILREVVATFINFPKPLIAAVNGPAVGISVTLLGLYDLVYAADNATFHTPFMQLGQSPEGCSSLTFPRMMGPARANEVLLGGQKLTSAEAYERGLVTRVFSSADFNEKVKDIVSSMSKMPPKSKGLAGQLMPMHTQQSLAKSKQLIRNIDKDELLRVNDIECELLEERWLSDECMEAITAFMTRKK